MISLRKIASHCTAFVLAGALACAPDAPTQPPTANLDLVGGVASGVTGVVSGTTEVLGSTVHGLLACKVTKSYSSSARIGSAGGMLRVGPHTLVVPRGALASSVTITANAPTGDNVTVHFEPEGLHFSKPSALTLSYSQCDVVNGLLLKVVYVDDDLNILETLLSVPNLFDRSVTGKVNHFSNYALAE